MKCRKCGILGRDFGVPSAEGELSALDAMTLKVTPPAEKPDAALRPSLLPQGAEAFAGRSGLEAYRGTAPVFVRWTTVETQVAHSGHELLVHAKDAVNLVELDVRLSLAEGGLVLMDERITNIDMEHEEPLTVNWLDSVLPIPRRADHLTQFTGRWPLEKQPQTGPLPRGSVTRDCRHGKTSHESPWLFIASDGEPLFDSGEVWACHLAWSGNQTYRLDNLPQHEPLLGAGELLGPGEIQLLPGSDYATPQVCFSWSDHGLDGMAARFHRWLRSLPNHVRGDRLVTLNTWEAVYFDHDEATLIALADLAAKVGVERFVLDDGWFHLRRDDTKGLGDWIVDPEVWPKDSMRSPSMCTPGHAVRPVVRAGDGQPRLRLRARAPRLDPRRARGRAVPRGHLIPHAVCARSGQPRCLPPCARADGRPDPRTGHRLHQVGPQPRRDRAGARRPLRPARADRGRLPAEFPGLEIESCASGGGRTDAGILQHADRIWASDSNDPRDRVDIQRTTELVVPPEMIGAHIGPSPAHSTWRATDLSYRAAMSLEGCSGFEWNILECTDEEIAQITAFVKLVKELRGLLHAGEVRHADFHDPALRARGVVADDASRAVWVVATVTNLRDVVTERLRPAGLDASRTYRVRLREEIGESRWGWNTPQWIAAAGRRQELVAHRHGRVDLRGRLAVSAGCAAHIRQPAPRTAPACAVHRVAH